jgi:hypothetical protein
VFIKPIPFRLTINISKLLFGELVLANSANRADPVIGKIFKSGAGGNSSILVAFCRVINISAYLAFPFFHERFLLLNINFVTAQLPMSYGCLACNETLTKKVRYAELISFAVVPEEINSDKAKHLEL